MQLGLCHPAWNFMLDFNHSEIHLAFSCACFEVLRMVKAEMFQNKGFCGFCFSPP